MYCGAPAVWYTGAGAPSRFLSRISKSHWISPHSIASPFSFSAQTQNNEKRVKKSYFYAPSCSWCSWRWRKPSWLELDQLQPSSARWGGAWGICNMNEVKPAFDGNNKAELIGWGLGEPGARVRQALGRQPPPFLLLIHIFNPRLCDIKCLQNPIMDRALFIYKTTSLACALQFWGLCIDDNSITKIRI